MNRIKDKSLGKEKIYFLKKVPGFVSIPSKWYNANVNEN